MCETCPVIEKQRWRYHLLMIRTHDLKFWVTRLTPVIPSGRLYK